MAHRDTCGQKSSKKAGKKRKKSENDSNAEAPGGSGNDGKERMKTENDSNAEADSTKEPVAGGSGNDGKDPVAGCSGNGAGSIKQTGKTVQEYYILINDVKTLVRVVDEGVATESSDTDTSIKEQKGPKTLKQIYTVSDSDTDTNNKGVSQLDGNGVEVISSANSSDDTSDIHILGESFGGPPYCSSSVEEVGDQISLAPNSSCPSNVTYSDTETNKSISQSLSEIFKNSYDSHANSDGDSHADSHADPPAMKSQFCRKCESSFYTVGALDQHYILAHPSKKL